MQHPSSCAASANQQNTFVLERDINVLLYIVFQASAIRVVAGDFIIPEIKSVYSIGFMARIYCINNFIADIIGNSECLELEGYGHVATLVTFLAQSLDGCGKSVQRRFDGFVADVLPGLFREHQVNQRRFAVGDGVADDGISISHDDYSLSSLSEEVNVQVRVITRMSVSLRISGGNGEKGAVSLTMRIAAASRMRWPDERLTSTLSTLPSARIATLSCNLP